jgi:glycosidase
VVDGEKVIADPYTEKILDPWNDKYIPADVYPNLKPYPEGKTEGIVSILQTGQQEYNWQYSGFQKPKKENLVIYELLVRDFVHMHDYQSILDTLNYLDRLNVNAIELMPINEFEGNESWGYNPSFMFAPDKYYGTKDNLKRFIDESHSRGIAVIIDIVMNHAFGQSPFVQLYDHHDENGEIVFDEPTPWFNERSPNQAYKWGADFNHESKYTQQLLDSINRFWMEEYKVDGFRFDFTKGFTNTPGDGWAYDASRIAILKRMYNRIMEVDTTAYVILEHLTENSEEKDLASYGLMLWGNMVNNYSEAAMGWNEGDKSDLGWACYRNRGWDKPNLVSYSSSHDEERIAYKMSQWGNSSGNYNIKEHATAMERMQLQAMFLYPIPGPKMMWQFDEVGYDISIDDPCRVCNKPILWEYTKDADRKRVYNLHRYMFKMKTTEPAFSTTDFSLDLDNGAVKSIILRHEDMNVVIIGNFDVVTQTATVTFPSTGTWYDYFEGTEVQIASAEQSIELQPGKYKMYTTKKFDKPNLDEYISTAIREVTTGHGTTAEKIKVYPMPATDHMNIQYSIPEPGPVTVDIFSMQGEKVESIRFDHQLKGSHTVRWDIRGGTPKGLYLVRISAGKKMMSAKVVVM